MSIRHQIKQQKSANKASLKYFNDFAEHRRQQTDLILSSNAKGGRICVLGAGNCYDIDLKLIAGHFDEVHLVDIDRDAISGAKRRVSGAVANKIQLHAPVDISGVNKHLEDWRDLKLTQETLLEFPELAINRLMGQLPEPFDCVVSSCLISQILLTCKNVMGEQHPLLEAGMITLLVTHLRTMVSLTKPAGHAFWTTDVSSNQIAPLNSSTQLQDGVEFLHRLASTNRIFTYLDPALISNLAQQDPYVAARAMIADPLKVWLWHNGPHKTFLVYALRFVIRKTADVAAHPSSND